jgi:extracellular factor (EF) 3-hydroxypalmitic acid methyl ester biosynthesis protein
MTRSVGASGGVSPAIGTMFATIMVAISMVTMADSTSKPWAAAQGRNEHAQRASGERWAVVFCRLPGRRPLAICRARTTALPGLASRMITVRLLVESASVSLDNLVLFRNSSGMDGRGSLLHVTRREAAFEVYNPYSIVQLSEVLQGFRVMREGRPIYQGRAVVTTLVPTGLVTIVSAALVDAWSDLHGITSPDDIHREIDRFIHGWEQSYRLRPSYQLAVGALASFLQDLSRWLNQAEAVYTTGVPDQPLLSDPLLLDQVARPVHTKLNELCATFEAEARQLAAEDVPSHKAFAQRELHPFVLCDPFLHRSFTKPLGYAGDYETVNMIVGESEARLNAYALILNAFHLSSAPAAAHRNRIRILRNMIRREARRRANGGNALRVLDIGCGPAVEVQRLVGSDDMPPHSEFTLVDFNEETLEFAERAIQRAAAKGSNPIVLRMVHQSIHELLEAASAKLPVAGEYDMIYCAGLFDYLSDRVCQKLVRLYYSWTAPGGVVVVTNVHERNPIRGYMEHLAEWYLVYRNEPQLLQFAPPGSRSRVFSDPTTVNIFLEVRRPAV